MFEALHLKDVPPNIGLQPCLQTSYMTVFGPTDGGEVANSVIVLPGGRNTFRKVAPSAAAGQARELCKDDQFGWMQWLVLGTPAPAMMLVRACNAFAPPGCIRLKPQLRTFIFMF